MALNLSTIGKKVGPVTKAYAEDDVILYALGVGSGFQELDYCYESRLKTIPSFSVASIINFFAEGIAASGANLAGILHGEQDTIFHNPIPTSGTLTTDGSITNIFDKGEGKGALVVINGDTYHSNGKKLFTNKFTLFCRKDGGFGGQNAPAESFEFPKKDPDFTQNDSPSPNQPLLYRLSGDKFFVHVDPEFAKASGFEMPIMHGLCTYGYACRAVIKHLFPGEPERMRRFAVRFSKPLYPGTPIKTQIWKIDEGRALFRVLNAKNDEVVLDRGVAEWISKQEATKRSNRGAINFENRVAIVTGAGAGLGKVYALELAKRGAKVVVNDLGGSRDGSGKSSSAADAVVKEIKDQGGEAVANYDSVATVEGGKAIVDTAIKAFGHLDILINNAGILRDKTLVKMEKEDWDTILAVHLNGAYNVTRPALVAMRDNNFGRIIMTTSGAGLFGNFGQTNYSAAKLALIGFMNTLKLEGEKYNIKVNAVAPIAATRLTEDVLPPDMYAKLKPEFISPLVLYLSSEQCPVTGRIYNAGMGFYGRVAMMSGPGAVLGGGKEVPSPEDVAAHIQEITSLKQPQEFESLTPFLGSMMKAFEEKPKEGAKASTLTVADVFSGMSKYFQADNAAGVKVVFQFRLSGEGGGDFFVEVADKTCKSGQGSHASPTTTLKMGAPEFLDMITGKLPAMQAYTSGKLKIEGDLMKSRLIEKLFKFQ